MVKKSDSYLDPEANGSQQKRSAKNCLIAIVQDNLHNLTASLLGALKRCTVDIFSIRKLFWKEKCQMSA